MSTLTLDPSHDAVQDYYAQLQAYATAEATHEGAVRTAFRDLLQYGSAQTGWTLVPEKTLRERGIRPDGTFVDHFDLRKSFWEAKDADDDPDAKWHIVNLIQRVTTVSVETVDIVAGLPDLGLP